MIEIKYDGRLGNWLFQYCLASILSNKFKLKIDDTCTNFIEKNNILINKKYKNDVELENNKSNFKFHFTDFYKNKLNICSYYKNILLGVDNYYQNSELIDEYFDFYKNLYIFPETELKNNEHVFCHVRLGDIQNIKNIVLPYEYYDEALSKLNFKKLFIASDTINHPIVKSLCDKYNGEIFNGSPAETINFGSRFKKMVLSEGTFSFWIACVSDASEILIPSEERKKNYGIRKWHGDIFYCKSINWTKI
jgi:hypothetical protein